MLNNILTVIIVALLFCTCGIVQKKQKVEDRYSYSRFFTCLSEYDAYTIIIQNYEEYPSGIEISTIIPTSKGSYLRIYKKYKLLKAGELSVETIDTTFRISGLQGYCIQQFECDIKGDLFVRDSNVYAGTGSSILITYNTHAEKYHTRNIISLYDMLLKCGK